MKTRSKPAPSSRSRVGQVAAWSFLHRRTVLLAWVISLVLMPLLGGSIGNSFTNNFSAGKSESQSAYDLLHQRFPSFSGDVAPVVFAAGAGQVTDPRNKVRISTTLAALRALPHVTAVQGPFDDPAGSQISPDRKIAEAVVHYDKIAGDLPTSAIDRLVSTTKAANSPGWKVVAGGQPVALIEKPSFGKSEGAGLLAAALILLLAFGSVVAMGLPILMALFGLAIAFGSLDLISHLITIPTFGPELAAILGIGVGIDYALFIVTRYRSELADGKSPVDAVASTFATAGTAVLFAGATVIISLLGLILVGLAYITGAAIAAVTSVLLVLTAALTLLPAVLGLLGQRIDSLRLPGFAASKGSGSFGIWWRWSRRVQAHPWLVSTAAFLSLMVLAVPLVSLRLGFGDNGNKPASFATRQTYDLLSRGFGRGSNGPLVVAVKINRLADEAAAQALQHRLAALPGVAAASPVVFNQQHDTAVVTVEPRTSPQDDKTVQLVKSIRHTVAPALARQGLSTVLVGGETAASIDSSQHLSSRLLPVIIAVVLLSLILLAMVFRSVAIPIKAAVMNLLATGAAYGVIVAVFQWGWFANVFNAGPTGPIDPWIPVMLFTILFGLSMDYELFLMSRVREEWLRTDDAAAAVSSAIASTARVITAAAAIMVCVFSAFTLGDERALKIFGLGMATAVFLDATLVRLMLVPAVMHLLGRRAWYLPPWLERVLPHVAVEHEGPMRPVAVKA